MDYNIDPEDQENSIFNKKTQRISISSKKRVQIRSPFNNNWEQALLLFEETSLKKQLEAYEIKGKIEINRADSFSMLLFTQWRHDDKNWVPQMGEITGNVLYWE